MNPPGEDVIPYYIPYIPHYITQVSVPEEEMAIKRIRWVLTFKISGIDCKPPRARLSVW